MEEKIQTLGLLKVPHFCVYLDEVRLKTGRISKRLKIEHPKAVAIIPRIDSEKILMVRQYRYAVGEETLEIPAGKVDNGESVKDAVFRELMEETGYTASSLKKLISYYPAIAYSNEMIDIFLAEGLKRVSSIQDQDEISRTEIVTIEEAFNMIEKGEIKDGKTIISILMLRGLLNEP